MRVRTTRDHIRAFIIGARGYNLVDIKRFYPREYEDRRATVELAKSLDPETSTREDVQSLWNLSGWDGVYNPGQRCDNCGQCREAVVEVGEEPDYESNTASMCEECLEAALALLRASKEGKA